MRNLVLDVDGVLTDGVQYICHTGDKLVKAFYSRDIRSIREFVAHGWRVVILSADDWPGSEAWCKRTGAEYMYARDKLTVCLGLDLDLSRTVAVGDDAWDVPLMGAVLSAGGMAFCPKDADRSVVQLAGVVILESLGGHGVIAEIAGRLL